MRVWFGWKIVEAFYLSIWSMFNFEFWVVLLAAWFWMNYVCVRACVCVCLECVHVAVVLSNVKLDLSITSALKFKFKLCSDFLLLVIPLKNDYFSSYFSVKIFLFMHKSRWEWFDFYWNCMADIVFVCVSHMFLIKLQFSI